MSSCSLIEWFEHLLFGTEDAFQPPAALYKLILRLESEGIHWQDVMRQGGLTLFRYHVSGDLDTLTDWLDRLSDSPSEPVFKTRIVTLFYNHLLAFLARPKLEPVLEQDQTILEKIVAGESSGSYRYVSASFWGELARGWISRRRPLPEPLCPLGQSGQIGRRGPAGQSDPPVNKTARLYDITCTARGEKVDPMSMVLMPAADYVNPAHWTSATTLESFMQLQPEHGLTRAIQQLLRNTLHQFLKGQYPTSVIEKNDDTLSVLLQNVACIDENVRKVSLMEVPPLFIDVLQRLLALLELDDLWVTVPPAHVPCFPKTDLMLLSEALLLADKQNKILLRHIQE